MLDELDKIKSDFDSSVKLVQNYIDACIKLDSFNIEAMKTSKFYNNIGNQVKELQRKFFETKIVKYNAIIISLYGSFELAIKSATKEMIRFMLINNFGEVEELKKENFAAITKVFERSDFKKKCSLINGLDMLYNRNDMSGYNYELSLNSYQNFKVNVIYQMARIIGIKDLEQRLKTDPFIVEYVRNEKGLSDNGKAIKYINSGVALFGEIDSLVESRNKIAHEGYEPQMIADNVILQTIIPQLILFVSVYIRILMLEILKYYKAKEKYFYEIKLLCPVINNRVICFNTGANKLNKNNLILVSLGGKYSLAKIINIQIDKNNVNEVPENTNVGCELDINIKDSHKFDLFLGVKK